MYILYCFSFWARFLCSSSVSVFVRICFHCLYVFTCVYVFYCFSLCMFICCVYVYMYLFLFVFWFVWLFSLVFSFFYFLFLPVYFVFVYICVYVFLFGCMYVFFFYFSGEFVFISFGRFSKFTLLFLFIAFQLFLLPYNHILCVLVILFVGIRCLVFFNIFIIML